MFNQNYSLKLVFLLICIYSICLFNTSYAYNDNEEVVCDIVINDFLEEEPYNPYENVFEDTHAKTLHLNSNCDTSSIGNSIIHENLLSYFPYVKLASSKYSIPIDYIYAIILEESTASNAETEYAIGPMQLEKSVWYSMGYTHEELANPKISILLSTEYLSSFNTDNIYEALGRYGRGENGWKAMKERCGIYDRDVYSFDEASYVLSNCGDINFILKMEIWRNKFNSCYSIY